MVSKPTPKISFLNYNSSKTQPLQSAISVHSLYNLSFPFFALVFCAFINEKFCPW